MLIAHRSSFALARHLDIVELLRSRWSSSGEVKPGSGVFSKDISKIHRRTELVGSRPAPFLPLLKQDFGSGWILEGPAYVGPGTLVVVPGLFILS